MSDDSRLPDDDEDVKLTREGWDEDIEERDRDYADWWHEQQDQEQFERDYAQHLEQEKLDQRTLRDWARYTLETGEVRCECRDGWRCQRCRVHAIVYPERMVREFETGGVPF